MPNTNLAGASVLTGNLPREYLPHETRYSWHDLEKQHSSQGHSVAPPICRSKHAACAEDGFLYVHGGKNGSVCYREMWRYSLENKTWEKLKSTGEQPLSPQEHTVIAYKRKLYVFGGQFFCTSDNEPPLWICDLDTLVWSKHTISSEVVTPIGRRGHTAVVFQGMMCIYGGYVDLKGSSNEVWIFDFTAEVWHLVNTSAVYDFGPDGRYSHSAIVHEGAMWVYGGMSDLQHRDDLWRWDFICSQWNRIKVRPSPPALKGHAAASVYGQMLIYGGSSQGSPSDSLWCFHYASTTWTKLVPLGLPPPICVNHCCVVVKTTVSKETDSRSVSYPQLKHKDQLRVKEADRPASSPPKLAASGIFNNKVTPSQSSPHKVNIMNLEGSMDVPTGGAACDKPCCGSDRDMMALEGPPQTEVQEYCRSSSVSPHSPQSSHSSLTMTTRSWWRSTSCLSSDSTTCEDIPLLELRRARTTESLSSAEYMDTVAGSYVNKVLTGINNTRQQAIHFSSVPLDNSPRSCRRQKSDDWTLDPLSGNHGNPRTGDSGTREEHQVAISNNNNHIINHDNRNSCGGQVDVNQRSFPPRWSHEDRHDRKYETRSQSLPADPEPGEELRLEDVEEPELEPLLPQTLNHSQSSEEMLNTSMCSETAPLLSGAGPSPAEPSQGSYIGNTVRACFVGRYSLLSNSSDSLPYGMVNPLYPVTPQKHSTSNSAGRAAIQNGASEAEADATHKRHASVSDTLPESNLSRNASHHGVIQNPPDLNPPDQNPPRYQQYNTPHPPPSYESLESGKSPLSRHMTTALSQGKDVLPQAWGSAVVDANAGPKEKPNGKDSAPQPEKQPGPASAQKKPAINESKVDVVKKEINLYLVGGQTTDVTYYDCKPLLLYRLQVTPGS